LEKNINPFSQLSLMARRLLPGIALHHIQTRENMKRPRTKRSLSAAATATVAFFLTSAAAATTLSYVTQGGAVAPDGRPLGATADFEFDAACTIDCLLTLTLANTEEMTGISQGLTDFHFTSTSLTELLLTGADGISWADCTSGTNPCTFSTANFDASSYGWTLTGSGGYALAATPLPDAGIVNPTIDATSDGVRNGAHNPWLVGPVDFFFTYSGALSISNVGFSFGTDREHPTIPACETDCCDSNCGDTFVPEPSPLALLGIGALALIGVRRHRHQAAR
jgi:hypothetical protein